MWLLAGTCNWFGDISLYSSDLVGKLESLELFLILQALEIFKVVDPNARTADFGLSQDHLVHFPKVRCLRCPMLSSDFVHLDSVPEVDFVEADVRRLVLTGGGRGHGEQGALRHGRHWVGC